MFSVMGHDWREKLAGAGECTVAGSRGQEGIDTEFGGRDRLRYVVYQLGRSADTQT